MSRPTQEYQPDIIYNKDRSSRRLYVMLNKIYKTPVSLKRHIQELNRQNPPLLTCDALIIHRQKILLIKRAVHPYEGFWVLPGGHVEFSEHPNQTVIREAKEETGLNCKITKFLGIYSDFGLDDRGHHISLAYVLKPINLKFKNNSESSAIKFFQLKEIPQKMGWAHRQIIADYLKFSIIPA